LGRKKLQKRKEGVGKGIESGREKKKESPNSRNRNPNSLNSEKKANNWEKNKP